MLSLLTLMLFFSFAYGQVCSSCGASGWDTSVPTGNSQTYSVPSLSGATYVWVVTGGLQILSGGNSSTVNIRVNGTGTLYVTRYKTGNSACANKATITAETGGCEMFVNHEPCYTTNVVSCPVPGAASNDWYVNGNLHIGGQNSSWIHLEFHNPLSSAYYHLRNTFIEVCARFYSSSGVLIEEQCVTYYAFCFSTNYAPSGTGEKASMLGEDLKIHPNPVSASDEIFFNNLPLEQIKSIRLLNLNGQIIQHFGAPQSNAIQLDPAKQGQGLYMLQFETTEGVISRKVLLE